MVMMFIGETRLWECGGMYGYNSGYVLDGKIDGYMANSYISSVPRTNEIDWLAAGAVR